MMFSMGGNMGGLPPVEPSSDQRLAAKDVRALYMSYVEAGFTEAQAFDLTIEIIRTVLRMGSGPST